MIYTKKYIRLISNNSILENVKEYIKKPFIVIVLYPNTFFIFVCHNAPSDPKNKVIKPTIESNILLNSKTSTKT